MVDLPRPGYIAACPRLTELTVFYPHPHPHPHPHSTPGTEIDIPLDTIKTARSALLELVNACNALPNFDTLQIVHFSLTTPPPISRCGQCDGPVSYTEQQKQVLRDQVQGVKDLAVDCLRKPETRHQEGEGRKKMVLRKRGVGGVRYRTADCPKPKTGRKKITLRVIELDSVLALPSPRAGIPLRFSLGSVRVEEYDVGFDCNNPPAGGPRLGNIM